MIINNQEIVYAMFAIKFKNFEIKIKKFTKKNKFKLKQKVLENDEGGRRGSQ